MFQSELVAEHSWRHILRMTADYAELERFNALAHDWWAEDGALKALHKLTPLRLDWMGALVSLSGKKVLDVGCGGGIFSESMARAGALVTGIDPAGDVIDVARAHSLESGLQIDYRNCTAEWLAQNEAQTFDIVTCLEVLEHTIDPAGTIWACSRLVRPGGTVFFATMNRNLRSFLYAIVGAEYVLGLLPEGTHSYRRFIRPSELSRNARNADLSPFALTGIGYSLLTDRFHLTRDASINYMLACTRIL